MRAAFLDGVLFSGLAIVTDSDRVMVGVFVVALIVLPWLLGATPGKLVVGLRLASVSGDTVRTERRGMPLVAAFGRAPAVWTCQPVSGLLWMVTMDRNRRPVRDRLCRTIVLSTR